MKSIHGKDIKIFACNSNKKLAGDIAAAMGLPLGRCTVGAFADGEVSISIEESVRGSDVFIIQSTCGPVNNNLMELLIMIDALKRASAGRITAVVPYYGYARQDRKAKARDPISAKLVANLITAAGADRVLTMDLHAAQIQGFFNIPVDHLMGTPILAPYFVEKFKNLPREEIAVVSPDLGSVTRARKFAERLDCPLAIIDKRRPRANVSEVMNIIGNVEGKTVILLDDMVDTAGSLCGAARALIEVGGAKEISATAPKPSSSWAAPRRFMPALPTAFFPARPSSASPIASLPKQCSWIPSPPRKAPKPPASRCSLSPPSLPRPSAASMRTSPSPRFSLDFPRIFMVCFGRREPFSPAVSLPRRLYGIF